jgi:hypothetical protein
MQRVNSKSVAIALHYIVFTAKKKEKKGQSALIG